jgi:hypothetical protein
MVKIIIIIIIIIIIKYKYHNGEEYLCFVARR